MALVPTDEEVLWYLPEHLSPSQQAALQTFRSHLVAEGLLLAGQQQDHDLLRFLKARQWQVDPATTMYTQMVSWRREAQVDTVYATLDFPELPLLMPHYQHFYHKTDRWGRPVYIELLGKVDCTAMLEVAEFDRIIQYHIWTWERVQRQLMPACSQLAGKPIIAVTVIVDLAGLSLRSFSLAAKRLLTAIMKIDQCYYPEHLGSMFLINTPCVFTAIWACVSPMLEERTRKKIVVLGSKYLDALTQVIPVENLPTMFGGKSECVEPWQSEGPWSQIEPCKSNSWLPVGPRKVPSSPPAKSEAAGTASHGVAASIAALKLSHGSSSSSLASSSSIVTDASGRALGSSQSSASLAT